MLKYNDKEIRNLVEQVAYLSDLHEAGKALASWGIKVVGQVTNADELPPNYTGDYGDAYAVGTEPPYDFYIWTRASIDYGEAYWFNFGQISIIGPQGPQGIQGEPGVAGASSTWYTGQGSPTTLYFYRAGDMYLNTLNGQTYRYNGINWVLAANIMGPQGIQGIRGQTGPQGEAGPQGPKGDTGDVGGFINIAGIIANTDQLPTPASLGNLTIAYLVGTEAPYNLYIQVGSTSETALWKNMGLLNVATYVTVDGQYQNVWNADTKIDDVKINDISQVTNGVANIPIATKDTVGVARFGAGLFVDAKGIVTPTSISNSTISKKEEKLGKISPYNIEYAVKAGLVTTDVLTTNDGWNEDEQAAARATLGITSGGGGAQLYQHKIIFGKVETSEGIYDVSEFQFVSKQSTQFVSIQTAIEDAFNGGLIAMATGGNLTYYSESDAYKQYNALFNFRRVYSEEHGQELPYCSVQDGSEDYA